MIQRYIIIVIALCTFFSCSTEERKDKKYLSDHITFLIPTLGRCYNHVIIIPGSGCSGCITVAEDFLKNNYKNPEYLFILTNITSLKILSHKVGFNVINVKNIIIDDRNEYSHFNLSVYPTVINYNCRKSKIENITYQKPGTNAFAIF